MRTKRTFLLFVIVLEVIAGCTPIPAIPSPSNNQELTEISNATPAETTQPPLPTETTIALSPTSTSSPIDKCLTIEPNYPAGFVSNGTLVSSSIENIGNNLVRYTAYRINMETHEKIELAKSGETILNVSISPNGNWIAYDKYGSKDKKDYSTGKKLGRNFFMVRQ
jgi:hypothetical protein